MIYVLPIPKLGDFKGQEKTTLLDFLVQQLHSKKPELLSMSSSLESVAKASESKLPSFHAIVISMYMALVILSLPFCNSFHYKHSGRTRRYSDTCI